MAKFRYEMFCHLVYDDKLSYEELIQREQLLGPTFSDLLQESGASFIDFQPQGDALYVQCVFAEQDAEDFTALSERLAALVGNDMEGRILFVGKDLATMYCFFMVNGVCRGSTLNLPSPRMGLAKRPPRMQYALDMTR